MSKKKQNITGARDDSAELLGPEPPPGRLSSSDVSPPPPAPRAARFGAGPEGEGVRRERGGGPGKSGHGPHTPGFFERAAQFLRDTRSEMNRVTWPSGREVYHTTVITIVAVIFFAVYLFAVDRVWAFVIEQLDAVLNKLTGVA